MSSKTIMITGATSGFGEACARLFASHGWQLILTGRRQQRLDDLQQELGGKDKVATCCFDVTDRKAVESAINSLSEPFKKIDVLVNNAGIYGPKGYIEKINWENYKIKSGDIIEIVQPLKGG